MIINSYSEFEKLVNKGITCGVVLICGLEKKLIDKSINIICSRLKSFPEFNIVKIDGENTTIDEVSNACETLPFMADYKIVSITNISFLNKQRKDNEEDQKQKKSTPNSELINYLIEFSGRKVEGVILLLTLDDNVDERNKLVASIKSNGYFIQFNPLKGEELYKWIQQYFEQNGKEINKTEILYLISTAGSRIEQLDKEVEKLCNFTLGENKILKEHIDAVVHKNLESNIFRMIDSIAKKDADSAIVMLGALLSQREKHLIILGMIIRQYRLMILAHEYEKQKLQPDLIGEKLKLKGYPLQNMIKQSRNYNEKSLKMGLIKCLDTDYKIKKGTFSGDELDLSLELLIIELCK